MAISSNKIYCTKGNYQILSDLNSGGMGNIYLGKDSSDCRVVIKTPKFTGSSNDPIMLQKIRIEAKILASLSHPNIIRYVDECDKPDNFWLIIEHIDGKNLEEIYKDRPASDEAVLNTSIHLLNALAYLHGEPNIIHRDVNPKNVMITNSDQRLVLIDFGAAKQGFLQLEDDPHTLIGRPGYAAPEQFTTGIVSPASDIYGVGSTMFYLLTNKKPNLFMDGGGDLKRSPREVNSSVAKRLSDIVLKAMARDPAYRYETALDMINDLEDKPLASPRSSYIVIQSKKYEIRNQLLVGKTHRCNDKCHSQGFYGGLDVSIDGVYVSKHHALISRDRNGDCWLEDLGSMNATAISHNSGATFQVLRPHTKVKLGDKDMVAIAYSPTKGAFITFTYVE